MRLQGGGGRYSSIIMKTSKNVRHYKLKNPSNNKTKLPPLYMYTPHLFRTKLLLLSLLYTHAHKLLVCLLRGLERRVRGENVKCKWSVRHLWRKLWRGTRRSRELDASQDSFVYVLHCVEVEEEAWCVFFLSKEKKRMITSRGGGGKKKAVNIDDRAQDRHTRFGAGGGTISTTHQFPFFFFFFLGPLVFFVRWARNCSFVIWKKKSAGLFRNKTAGERDKRPSKKKRTHGMYFR
jgi:hypothetical protein